MATAGVMGLALVLYVLTGGADFGGGVWDLLARGPRRRRQRALVAAALAPVWEANHVWLILLVVLLFVGFPNAFAAVGIALHLPLSLMLAGIVLRGTAFVFRAYDPHNPDETVGPWRLVFAVSSTVTPVMLGTSLGALATDTLPLDPATGIVQTDFVSAWLAPWPFLVGLLTLGLCALLAAVYLTLEAREADLQDDYRWRALATQGVVALLAPATLVLGMGAAPRFTTNLLQGPVSLGLVTLATAGALATTMALRARAWRWARRAVVVQVGTIVAGFGFAQLPVIVGPDLTIASCAAPDEVLRPVLMCLALGAPVLAAALWWLYRVFKAAPSEG